MANTSRSGEKMLTLSAGIVSIGVMVSRILGLVREMVLAYFLDARLALDAFYAGFRVPNLLRDMFGEGALSKAFVATFTEIQEKHGRERALQLANGILNLLILVVGGLTLLGIWYADAIVGFLFQGGGFDLALPDEMAFGFSTKRELTVFLTRVMFPFILMVSVAALVMGVLNAAGKFFVPAFASTFFNVGSIVVGITGYYMAPRLSIHPSVGFAVGVLAGGSLQLAWQVPSLLRLGFRYRPWLSLRDPWLAKVLRLFGPGALMAGTVQVNLMVNSYFASYGEAWLTWIVQAFRVLHLPIGLVGVAVSVAALPALSRLAAQENKASFKETFSYALRLVFLFTVPAMVGLLVLAEPIVRLIYERGQFGADDTLQVAAALRFYAIGLVGFAAIKIVTDGFYALQDVRIPTLVAFGGVVANAFLNWLFVVGLGLDHRGLALSTSATMSLSCAFLWVLFRRRSELGGIGGHALTSMAGKTVLVSAVMGIVAFAVSGGFDATFGHEHIVARLVQVLASVASGLLVFRFGCRLLGVTEFESTWAAVWSRRRRASAGT